MSPTLNPTAESARHGALAGEAAARRIPGSALQVQAAQVAAVRQAGRHLRRAAVPRHLHAHEAALGTRPRSSML